MVDECVTLLGDWCRRLRKLQVVGTGDPRLDGGILCPACGKIHGRCADAMYPFLCMANLTADYSWVESAIALFNWTESAVSQEDGSILNDIDSSWTGITVLYAIQLADCLSLHGGLLTIEEVSRWKSRLKKAACFIDRCDAIYENNINYTIAAARALFAAGSILADDCFKDRAKEIAAHLPDYFTDDGLLFGEGVPKRSLSRRKCRPIDIGYDVEESLPLLVEYAYQAGDSGLAKCAVRSLRAHLSFMLGDGGWDNSFGTRKFKWTYWGSRTTDGCIPAYLLTSKGNDDFSLAAFSNFRLLQKCTHHGLLMGGPAYVAADQPPCVHHTFEHAKALAKVIDEGLSSRLFSNLREGRLPRMRMQGLVSVPAAGIHVLTQGSFTATICHGDWEYLRGGSTSGGSVGILYHERRGAILCSGIGEYIRKERNNMQVPTKTRHECLVPRIELVENESLYSNMYENDSNVSARDASIVVSGQLKNDEHMASKSPIPFELRYTESPFEFVIEAFISAGILVVPVICDINDSVEIVRRDEMHECAVCFGASGRPGMRLNVNLEGDVSFPFGKERIFNLVPGFQALRVDIKPRGGRARVAFSVS